MIFHLTHASGSDGCGVRHAGEAEAGTTCTGDGSGGNGEVDSLSAAISSISDECVRGELLAAIGKAAVVIPVHPDVKVGIASAQIGGGESEAGSGTEIVASGEDDAVFIITGGAVISTGGGIARGDILGV